MPGAVCEHEMIVSLFEIFDCFLEISAPADIIINACNGNDFSIHRNLRGLIYQQFAIVLVVNFRERININFCPVFPVAQNQQLRNSMMNKSKQLVK